MSPLAPGATIGIVGGGQLGRMLALAAARLGLRAHVLTPEPDAPALAVAAAATCADPADLDALRRFAAAVDVVTFEYEDVPPAALAALAAWGVPCRPDPGALAICQDRVAEKRFLDRVGVRVTPWRPVGSRAELDAAIAALGLPAVLKTTRSGYDGRGQVVLREPADARAAFDRLAPHPLVLESWVPFDRELSVIVARGADGAVAAFDPVENRHRDHILDLTFAPARVAPEVAAAAVAQARAVVAGLGFVGVAALELFLCADGALLGNEIAPRPHNSGHWTIEACLASQFEQHCRAVAGWPLANPVRHHDAVMRNLVGVEGAARFAPLLGIPGVVPHWYGKVEARPGRKLGHAIRLFPRDGLAALDDAAALTGL